MEDQFENLKKLLVTKDIAFKLKELGFDQPCIAWCFGDKSGDIKLEFSLKQTEINILVPTWEQALAFLRNSYNTHIDIISISEYYDGGETRKTRKLLGYQFMLKTLGDFPIEYHGDRVKTYEESIKNGIKYTFKLLG